MTFDEARPQMTLEELHLLADLFRNACGFHLRDELRFVAERRLASRLEVLGLRDFAGYHRYLRFDPKGPEELETAIDVLLPRETYFFREPAQLDSFRKEVLPELAETSSRLRSLNAWSAGCSTGEEPYTVGILLEEEAALAGWHLDVLGTDLSRQALTTARRAEYGPSALRSTTPEQRARYFDALDSGRVRVKPRYRQQVRFGLLNLADSAAVSALPRFDVVFCRNVLIYFDAQTRRRIVDAFFSRLREGGFLLLGHSENLLSGETRFELVQLEGDLVYRRPRG